MSPARNIRAQWLPILVYGLPLLVYCAIAAPLAYRQREMMNADAMCYIRRSIYLLHGQFYYFISEHWSLMLSWLIAPLIAARFDGLYAARIVTTIVGALYLLLFIALTARLLNVHWIWRLLAGVVIAPFIAAVAVRVISPDQLLAMWLVLYFLIVLDPNLLQKRGRQLLAGIVGGIAYLAKAFALPFVIVHLLLTLIMHAVRIKNELAATGTKPTGAELFKRVAAAYGRGLLGFCLIASPWVAAMSWKYAHFTVGSSGAAAHGVTGADLPSLKRPHAAMKEAMLPPPGPYVSFHEIPEKFFPRWSPFESRENFIYQLHIIRDHACWLLSYLGSIATGYVAPIGIGIAMLLLMVRSPQRWKLYWLLLTLGLFLGPFLLVVFQNRYVNPHVVPPALLLCLLLALEWRPARAAPAPSSEHLPVHWPRAIASVIVLAAFAWQTLVWIRPLDSHTASNTYRLIGNRIKKEKLKQPFASDSPSRALLVAYHSGHKYVPFPRTNDPERAQEILRGVGANYVIVWDTVRPYDSQSCAAEMVQRPPWKLALHFRGASVFQYDAKAASTMPSSRPTKAPPSTQPSGDALPDLLEGIEDDFGAFEEPAPTRQKPGKAKKTPQSTTPASPRKKAASP
jgi:hypothetical protein